MGGSKTKIRERTRGKKDRRGRVWIGGVRREQRKGGEKRTEV